MRNFLIILLVLVCCICSCNKEEANNDAGLSSYTKSEAVDLNYKCFAIFNQFAVKPTGIYEDGAVEVVYAYTADVLNAQYQGKVDLTFKEFIVQDKGLTINGSGYVFGLMDSYNGQYVVTYSGNLNGTDNEKSYKIEFNFEIIQAQSLSNVGYFEVNGVRYDFDVDGTDLPNLVKK